MQPGVRFTGKPTKMFNCPFVSGIMQKITVTMQRLCRFIVVLLALFLCAAQPTPLTLSVGGLKAGVVVEFSGETTLREPDGPRGQYKHGFRVLNDSAAEWQNFYGVQFEVNLPDAREVELTATIQRAPRGPSPETPVTGTVRVSGAGWYAITLPWSAVHLDQAAFPSRRSAK